MYDLSSLRRFLDILGYFSFFCAFGFLWPAFASAAPVPVLTLRYRHFLFPIPPAEIQSWITTEEALFLRTNADDDIRVRTPPQLRVESDTIIPLPASISRRTVPAWDTARIRASLEQNITPTLAREPRSVTIAQTGSTVTFRGIGMLGRALDADAAARLIVDALVRGVPDVFLPVIEIPPTVIVEDPLLRTQGIRALVGFGESDFAGSPPNRIHNLTLGLRRINATRIPFGEEFSFARVIGHIDETTGYRKELTILGERTLPEFGGGLCQVSTTVYRAAWEGGLPITARKNHSFAVRYYAPQGTDATVYPPHIDLRFRNDTPGTLLLQTHVEDGRAYAMLYGTPDDRRVHIIGPYTWDYRDPPQPRTEYTTEIAPSETRKVGDPVPGMKALWFRETMRPEAPAVWETMQSGYEARPLFTQIGIAGTGSLAVPNWLGLDPSS